MKHTFKILFTALIITLLISFISNKSFSQVTDKDGNSYKTVTISKQIWMAENFNVEHYRNGDPIPQVQDKEEWDALTTGAWCYYDNNSENGTIYGKLYNWYAVNDPRGLAPEGWHIPSDTEWKQLSDFLGGEKDAGGKMKSSALWNNPNTGATNESGFTGLPGGVRVIKGYFSHIGKYGCFWSSSENNSASAWNRYLEHNYFDVFRFSNNKEYGFSCRCIKD